MSTYFTSDHHFGHAGALGLYRRPVVEDPGTFSKWMGRVDFTRFGGKAEHFGADVQKSGCLCEIEPGFDAIGSGTIDRNPVMRPERRHALARPTIAVAGDNFVSIQNTGDEIVAGEQNEFSDGGDYIGRSAVALPFALSRQTAFCMNPAHPMDHENDLGSLGVNIGDPVDDRADTRNGGWAPFPNEGWNRGRPVKKNEVSAQLLRKSDL
jgi:hypothetical protein